ncbi:MAG: phage capsid protein [Nitrospirales bacterium]|nr:MAG: phage capsid protein [Nitrospirales bacterium]
MDEIKKLIEEIIATQRAFQGRSDKHDSAVKNLQAKYDELVKQIVSLEIGGGGGYSAGKRDEDTKKYEKAWWMTALRREVNDSDIDRHFQGKYSQDFEAMIRLGKSAPAEVWNSMQVGSQPDGGILCPIEMQRDVYKRMWDDSPVRQSVKLMQISAGGIEWPTVTDDTVASGWVGETEPRPETASPEFGTQSIYLREQYANPSLTQKLVDDATIPVIDLVMDIISDKLIRTENAAFVAGSGVNQPRGFADYTAASVTTDDATRAWGVIQHVVSGDNAGFPTVSGVPGASDPDALVTMVSKLKSQYRAKAKWAMNRQVAGELRKLKDGEGRYLWRDGLENGQPDRLLGYPVMLLESLPNIATGAFPIWFGDWSRGYMVVDHLAGLRVLRDPFTVKGKIFLYTTKRVGSDIIDFDALKALKIST